MDRRKFFAAFASVPAAGAAVTPAPASAGTAIPDFLYPRHYTVREEPFTLTLASINRAFTGCWYGNQTPTEIYFARDTWMVFRNCVGTLERGRIFNPAGRLCQRGHLTFDFSGAEATMDSELACGEIWLLNTNKLNDPDPKWHARIVYTGLGGRL